MELYKKPGSMQRDLSAFFRREDLSKVYFRELFPEDEKKANDHFSKLFNIQNIIDDNSRLKGNPNDLFQFPPKQELIGILFEIKSNLELCFSSKPLNFNNSFYEFIVCVSNAFNSHILIMELISQIMMYLSYSNFPPEFVHIIQNYKFFIFAESKVIQENFITACINFLFDDISFDLLFNLNFHSEIFSAIEICNHPEVISCSFTYLYYFICLKEAKNQTNFVENDESIADVLLRTINYMASTNRIEFLAKAYLNIWEIVQNKDMLCIALKNNLVQILTNILFTNNNPELFLATCRFLIDIFPINPIFEDDSFYSRYEYIIKQHYDEFGPFIDLNLVKECPISEIVKLIGIDILEKLISNYYHKLVQNEMYHMIINMIRSSSFFLKVSICRFFLTAAAFSSKENRIKLINNETADLLFDMLCSKNIAIELIVLSSLVVFVRDDPEFWVGFITNKLADILQDIYRDEESEPGVVELAYGLIQIIDNQDKE